MSTTGARTREGARRPQSSFDSTSSSSTYLPSSGQDTLEEQITNVTLQRESFEGERECEDVAGKATITSPNERRLEGGLWSTPETIKVATFEVQSPDRTKPLLAKQCGTSASEAVDIGAGFTGGAEGESEEEPKDIAQDTHLITVRQMQEMIRKKCPSLSAKFVESLGISRVGMVLATYGMLADFPERRPDTFSYYRDSVVRGNSGHLSLVGGTGNAASSAAAADGPPRPASRGSSTTNSDESTKDTDEEDDEWARCPVEDGSPMASSCPHQSLAQQDRVRSVQDSEVQTLGCCPESHAECEHLLAQRKARVAKLEMMMNSIQLSPPRETEDLHADVFKSLKRAAPPPPCSTAEKKVRRVVNEQTITASGEACTEDSPLSPPPSLLCEKGPSLRPKQEGQQRAPAIDLSLSPLFTGDKVPRGPLKRRPVPEFPELPGMVRLPQSGPTGNKKMRM